MGAMVSSMRGDIVGSMIRAIVCLMGNWPGGLMESSQERIIGLMEAVIGSMGATDGSLGALGSMGDANRWRRPDGLMGSSQERIIGLMVAIVGSMGAVEGSMGASIGLMVGAVIGSVGRSSERRSSKVMAR